MVLEELRGLRKLVEAKRRRPLAMTYTMAGQEICRGPKTIARMVERGDLLSIRGEGKSRLIATEELERWVAERQEKPRRRSGGPKKKEKYSAAAEAARLDAMLRQRRKRQ